jgi:hypothetical protein
MRRKDSLGNTAGISLSDIANCATRTGFLIDPNAHEYETYKVVKFNPISALDDYIKKNPQYAVDIESNTIDTEERKMFFSHLAKHFVTTTTRSGDKQGKEGKEIIDAWYIDHDSADNRCAPDFVHTEPYYAFGTTLVLYPQIARFHHTGPIPTGLRVKLNAIQQLPGEKGKTRKIALQETVEELIDKDLSSSLFELPSGFHENPHLFGAR